MDVTDVRSLISEVMPMTLAVVLSLKSRSLGTVCTHGVTQGRGCREWTSLGATSEAASYRFPDLTPQFVITEGPG